MNAVECAEYGPPEVLKITQRPKPVPSNSEILIRIHATAVSSGDVRIRRADPFAVRLMFGLVRPKNPILGFVLAGKVEAVGRDVTLFDVGDEVFGITGMGFGAYAEFICLPETAVVTKKPEGMTFQEAAAIPFGGGTSLFFLKQANIRSGQKVLIFGASGALGTSAVQLAKHFGASVTGVCSTRNLDLVRSLGADRVVDYTKEDFTRLGETYDVIFDTIGKSPFSGCIRSLGKNGYYLRAVHMNLSSIARGLWVSLTSSKKVIGGVVDSKIEDLDLLKDLFEAGRLKAVIDRIYPLEQIAEAHRFVEEGHKRGNVIVTLGPSIKPMQNQ